jgi:prophage regulatory protein
MEKVVERVGLKDSSIQAQISAGLFPAPVDLGGGRAVGFVSSEVDRWIEERIAASRSSGAAARAMREARTPIAARRAHEGRKKRVCQARAAVPAGH